jgi:hypothetical protein
MTDQEKLQRLFDAALRDSTPVEKAPTRAVPQSPVVQPTTPIIAEKPAAPAAPVVEQDPDRQLLAVAPALDKAAAEELGVLLDAQIRRRKLKHRRESLVAALVLLGLTGGGSAWFVQSPERIQALTSAIKEIRSVGDVKSMVAKYEAALQRVKARGQQIDQATGSMGVKISGDEKDPYFNAEMKEMMGGEGKTSGDRDGRLQQAFGEMQEEHGKPAEQVASSLDEMDLPERDQ